MELALGKKEEAVFLMVCESEIVRFVKNVYLCPL